MHRTLARTLVALTALTITAAACSPSPVATASSSNRPIVLGHGGHSRYKIAATTTSTSTSTTQVANPTTTVTSAPTVTTIPRPKVTTTTAAPAPTAAGTSTPTSSQQTPRDPALWPFAVSSPFNTPIGSGAQFANDGDARSQAISGLSAYINAGAWSQPIYVASTTDPVTTVDGSTFHIPANAQPSLPAGGDQALNIIDPTHHYLDEMWSATGSGSSWSAGFHVRTDLTGSGVDGGVRAAGVSEIGGLIRNWELYFGSIRHALAMALPRAVQQSGSVWPATSQDYDARSTYGGSIPVGTLFAIPPSVNINNLGLSPQGLVIAKALQQFGAYDLDSASDQAVFCAEPSAEGSIDAARADISSLVRLLRPVTNNSPSSVGGGGSPTTQVAPPLDR